MAQLIREERLAELRVDAAWTYGMLRQFRAARRLYDRALDIIPNDPDLMQGTTAVHINECGQQHARNSVFTVISRAWKFLAAKPLKTALLLHGPAACLNECFSTFGNAPLLDGIVEIYRPDMKYDDDNLA